MKINSNYIIKNKGSFTQGIWDLSKRSLLERVSAGEVLEANRNLPICINFTVFSFVMRIIIKTLVTYLDVMLYFLCPKPAPLILQMPNI